MVVYVSHCLKACLNMWDSAIGQASELIGGDPNPFDSIRSEDDARDLHEVASEGVGHHVCVFCGGGFFDGCQGCDIVDGLLCRFFYCIIDGERHCCHTVWLMGLDSRESLLCNGVGCVHYGCGMVDVVGATLLCIVGMWCCC
jgi:hypothetical protein